MTPRHVVISSSTFITIPRSSSWSAPRATEAVLERLARQSEGICEGGDGRIARGVRPWHVRRLWLSLAAVAATVLATAGGVGVLRHRPHIGPPAPGKPADENVAWLLNAQDCLWDDAGQRPGRDMPPARNCT